MESNKNNEVKVKSFKEVFINAIVFEVIFMVLVILTIIFSNRVEVFTKIFGSFFFNLNLFGIILYYASLILGFGYFTIYLIFILILKLKNMDYKTFALKYNKMLDIPLFLVKSISLVLFIMIYVTTPCTISGNSMYPTFKNGERVLCSNLVSSYNKGDVVVFDAYNAAHDNSFYVKRIAAVEGDVIKFDREKDIFYINNEIIESINVSAFNNISDSIGLVDVYEYKVPKNKYLVLGDNSSDSKDSRDFGFINKDDIFGVVYFRFFPFNKIGGF